MGSAVETDSSKRADEAGHIGILDGWRAASILLVLAGHFLPLGPKVLQLNDGAAATGMAIFFTLSGFLICRILLRDPQFVPFLIRRLFRIVPLAWAAMLTLALVDQATWQQLAANLGFWSNLPPAQLMHGGEHLWSLCVEVQFYLFVALLVLVGGRKALFILPVVGLAVTGLRIMDAQPISIVTWHRVDEILAGCTLALLYEYGHLKRWTERLPVWTSLLILPVLLLSGTNHGGPIMYARPYLAAAAVGISLYRAPALMTAIMTSAAARYIAAVSYALYVFHGMLSATWLGSGETVEKYLKRPLLFAATFALAHLSTFYYEKPMIGIGKRLARKASRNA